MDYIWDFYFTPLLCGIYEKTLACLPLREPPNTPSRHFHILGRGCHPGCQCGAHGWRAIHSALAAAVASSLQCTQSTLDGDASPGFWLAVGSQPQ